MLNFEEEMKEWREFAHLLEKSSFSDVKKFLLALRSTDYPKYKRFFEYLEDNFLWIKISKHKISLAMFVANHSKAVAFPEDRTRIVLTLATLNGKSFEEANKIMTTELGDYFHLLPSYKVPGKSLSFIDIIKRAVEIRNGLKNICYLNVESTAKETLVYFKNSRVNDEKNLLEIRQSAMDLMAKIRDVNVFISGDGYLEAMPDLEKLYRLTGRTEFEIRTLRENPNYEEIAKFVYMMVEISSIKLGLIKKNISPNDVAQAEKIIFNKLADIEFKNKISLDELERFGMPLPKMK